MSERTSRFRRLWLTPLALALLTGGGLASALIGDGIWDALSWLALGIPAAVAIVLVRSSLKSSRP